MYSAFKIDSGGGTSSAGGFGGLVCFAGHACPTAGVLGKGGTGGYGTSGGGGGGYYGGEKIKESKTI
jgi:hypothetical protein